MGTKDPRPERAQTDESLAVERAKADHALTTKAESVEETADDVIERAREDADAVLSVARAKADAQLDGSGPLERTKAAVEQERALEDRQVRTERAEADERLRRQRAATLARLLPIEREKTDLYLLTERARSDAALANRDDFLGMVSHDLRDLLNAIVGNAAVIAASAADSTMVNTSLVNAQRIQRSASRMARLIGDLVDIASIDAGKLAVVPVTVDAAEVVFEAVEMWTGAATAKDLVLEAITHGPMPVQADHERILQVLGNLITNAVKFSPAGAKIVIACERVGDDVRFSVRDQGIGIPTEKLSAIFERFSQVGMNDHRGLGLGLYISQCLVHAHGGKIWAESEPGTGSTFCFTVPGSR